MSEFITVDEMDAWLRGDNSGDLTDEDVARYIARNRPDLLEDEILSTYDEDMHEMDTPASQEILKYTYNEYLDEWDGRYDEDRTTVEVEYKIGGLTVKREIHRMSEEEFLKERKELSAVYKDYEDALAESNASSMEAWGRMEEAAQRCLPIEVDLLI